MGIPLQALQLRPIAMKLMISMATILMLAYLATNIQSRTYLVQTASKDHGYESRRRMESGTDYGADYYDTETTCLYPGANVTGWENSCRVFNPPDCRKFREATCIEHPIAGIPEGIRFTTLGCRSECQHGYEGLVIEQQNPVSCEECSQWSWATPGPLVGGGGNSANLPGVEILHPTETTTVWFEDDAFVNYNNRG